MDAAIPLLADLLNARQHNRILRLTFPNNDGPRCELVVNRIEGSEYVSRDFRFAAELLSDRGDIALKDMLGKLLCIELVRADGTLRYFSGYCFTFRLKKAGNISLYEAILEPWLRYLSLGKDNYIFHGKTLREQTEIILSDYSTHASWDLRLTGNDPRMTDAMQFQESDHNYLHRRWEAAGWHYFYAHSERGHTLVLSDNSTLAESIDGYPEIAFHRHGGSAEEEAISAWSSEHSMQATSVALSSFDFKQPYPRQCSVPTANDQGSVLHTEYYEYAGAYGFANASDGDAKARLGMEEREANARTFHAVSNARCMAPGRWFSFADRFDEERLAFNDPHQNCYLIIKLHHLATNNYLRESESAPHYRNSVSCIRKEVPWRPGRGYNSREIRMQGPQTATVVGPGNGENVFTDEYGRIKVQFHWDREGANDDGSSAWLRVASPWAGSQLGMSAIPRVGSEVLVQWLDACPDRPYISGALHNERYMPAWSLPAQLALTGFRTRELAPGGGNSDAGRSNHLILDDTHKKIQVQLKSDHLHSQLSLGYITRIEDNAGRKERRGEGWELASDGWGVARAAKGLLITTEARPRAAAAVKDMSETLQRLTAAHELHEELAAAAREQRAQNAEGQQAEVTDAIKAQNDAIKGKVSNAEFPELEQPHLVLSSPAGIQTTTSQSTHIASDWHTALTAGKNMSIAAGAGLFASVGETFRLFVQKAGMKLIAASGKVTIQAQSDDVEVIAKKVLAIISEQDWVEIRGKVGIRLYGGGDTLEISKTSQFLTSRPVLFHGNLETLPSRTSPSLPDVLPNVAAEVAKPGFLYHTLQSHVGGKECASVPYSLFKDGVKIEDGLTDDFGRVVIEHTDGTPEYTVKLANGEEISLRASARIEHPDPSLSNQGMRALHDTPESRYHE